MKNFAVITLSLLVGVSAANAGFDDSNTNGIIYWSPKDLSSTMVRATPGETIELFAIINNNNLNYGHTDTGYPDGTYDPGLNWAPAIGYQIGAYWDTDAVDGASFNWDNNPGYDGPNGQGDIVSIYNDHTYWLFANANYGEWNMSSGEVARYDHYAAWQVQSNRGIYVGAYHPYAYLYENSIITQFSFTVPLDVADNVESTGWELDEFGQPQWYYDSGIGITFDAWNVYENPQLLSAWSLDQELITLRVLGTNAPGGRTGDFDGDGDIDADDIDALGAAIQAGSLDLTFDMDGDGFVTQADFDLHVTTLVDTALGEGTGSMFGDFNLDGTVDLLDLATVGDEYGVGLGWATGDSNGDGLVDLLDLAAVGDNYGFAASVPEPATMTLLGLGAVALIRRKK